MTKREICLGLFKAIHYLEDYKRALLSDKRAKKSFNFDDLSRSIDTICQAILALEQDDHFADLGKKGAALPDGTPINLCGGDK